MRRKARVRAKIFGTAARPRLSVFRSNRHLSAQLIDDTVGKTVISVSSGAITDKKKISKTAQAEIIGKLLAEKAMLAKIGEAVFDRGQYKFHGRVKALAEAAKKQGLKI